MSAVFLFVLICLSFCGIEKLAYQKKTKKTLSLQHLGHTHYKKENDLFTFLFLYFSYNLIYFIELFIFIYYCYLFLFAMFFYYVCFLICLFLDRSHTCYI